MDSKKSDDTRLIQAGVTPFGGRRRAVKKIEDDAASSF